MRLPRHKDAILGLAALQVYCYHTAAATGPVECLHTHSSELAQVIACGHEGSIQHCLSKRLPQEPYLFTQEVLQACLVDAGCTVEEAHIEAAWSIKRCEASLQNGLLGDLRRRVETMTSSTSDKTSTTTASSASSTTTDATATSTPETTAISTTSASTSSTSSASASSVSSASSTSSASSASSSSSASATSSTATSSTSSNTCITTTEKSTKVCPTQSTGSQSGKTLSCYHTTIASTTCAPGLLCETDSGVTSCMVRRDSLDVAGIIISICFSAVIAFTAFSICFCCCRERRRNNRIVLAAEAAAISKQALDKKRPSTSFRTATPLTDAQPLT